MVETLVSLFLHQAWADAELLSAVRAHSPAAENAQLRDLLHHIHIVQAFFHTRLRSEPFDAETVMRKPASLEELIASVREMHGRQLDLVRGFAAHDLERTVAVPELPGGSRTVTQILLQVVMHSQGHRAQAATKLRELGGSPPTMDYILWCQLRPAPVYSS